MSFLLCFIRHFVFYFTSRAMAGINYSIWAALATIQHTNFVKMFELKTCEFARPLTGKKGIAPQIQRKLVEIAIRKSKTRIFAFIGYNTCSTLMKTSLRRFFISYFEPLSRFQDGFHFNPILQKTESTMSDREDFELNLNEDFSSIRRKPSLYTTTLVTKEY